MMVYQCLSHKVYFEIFGILVIVNREVCGIRLPPLGHKIKDVDREEVHFRNLEFWTILRREKEGKKERQREILSSVLLERALFSTNLRVVTHYLHTHVHTLGKNIFSPYIEGESFFCTCVHGGLV